MKKILLIIYNSCKLIIDPILILIYKITKTQHWKGYNLYKFKKINESINNIPLLESIKKNKLPANFGINLDESVVEYPWIFSNLNHTAKHILDAGSTFNFKIIIEHPYFQNRELNIFTFYPERENFKKNMLTYHYGDLRNMPYSNSQFDCVICQSTIEHIDMDNSIYGYKPEKKIDKTQKSYSYLLAINELLRVLKPAGTLLLTFPFRVFENHDFFQQFDSEMLNKIINILKNQGTVDTAFIKYTTKGWEFSTIEKCYNSHSYNPHTGKGKGTDGAAHSRSICCINFKKN